MTRSASPSARSAGERGIALLVTLLVVTLLTIIVIEFTHSTEVDAHLTRNALNAVQARYLARSGVALAELTLLLDAEQKSKSPPERTPIETPGDTWAAPFPPMPVGEGFGTAGFTILDESSRFNLNALSISSPPAQPAELEMRKQLFQGILEALEIDKNLLFPVLDWLDPGDDTDRESGAESPYYLGLTPPYLPRNGRLLGVDELALVKGCELLSREQWLALRSLVTVLPSDELKINVHTAPELLLLALFTAIDNESAGRTLVSQRAEQPFQNAAGLRQFLDSYNVAPLVRDKFDVRSTIFTIHAQGSAGGVERGLAVTEQRPSGVFPPRLVVLEWREETAPFTLTSPGSSAGMKSVRP